ncbi:MAG: CAP domain-containing protein [bacterium]
MNVTRDVLAAGFGAWLLLIAAGCAGAGGEVGHDSNATSQENERLRWNSDLYAEYDHESFFASIWARQQLDLDHLDYPRLQAAIFFETNRRRVQHDLTPFNYSAALESIARQHSQDMANHDFFSHHGVVAGRETLSLRLALIGITNAVAAENISTLTALEYEDSRPVYSPEQNGGYFSYSYRGKPLELRTYASAARVVLEQWLDSPGHRQNILNPDVLFLGVGTAFFADDSFHDMPKFMATQNFASVPGNS